MQQASGAIAMKATVSRSEEQKLIEQAQNGNVAAFEALYRSHIGRVYGLCLRMTGQAANADDCAQETFIKAWNKLSSFRGQSAFSTWLHSIAVNQVLGRKRSRDRRGAHLELLAGELGDAATPASDGEDADLERAIERLPDGARDVLLLCGIYGYSHEEASDMLGIAVGTSKAQLHRARRLIRDQLDN